MWVLGIDTATPAAVVALCDIDAPGAGVLTAGTCLEARDDPPAGARPRHTTRVLPLAAGLLRQADLAWGQVERVAVGVGPGTFTGLRIGVAMAHGVARAQGIPLLGISSLAALAAGAMAGGGVMAAAAPPEEPTDPLPADGSILAVIDARRGEAFAAAWAADRPPPADPIAPATVLTPPELEDLAAALPAPVAVGEGALAFREVLERAGTRVPAAGSPAHLLSATWHCRLAAALAPGAPAAVLPDYLRAPDAERSRRA